MSKASISLRIPSDILDDVDTIAEVTERDRTWVVVRALKKYLEEEGGNILIDAPGVKEAREGECVDLDEMLAQADAKVDAALKNEAGQ